MGIKSVHAALAGLWLVLCAFYVSRNVGWANLFSLLPHEFFGVVMAALLPVLLLLLLALMGRVAGSMAVIQAVVTDIRERDGGSTEFLAMMSRFQHDSRETAAALIEAQTGASRMLADATRESRDGIVAELRVQGVLAKDSGSGLVPAEDGSMTPAMRIERMRALAELINLALNDLSMTATQLLMAILKADELDREEMRKFISTLTDAYFSGDKNVFFRSLALELETRLPTLLRLAGESDLVRNRVSKILREARQVKDLMGQCDPEDLIRIVFEDGDLWVLEKALLGHFDRDGTLLSS